MLNHSKRSLLAPLHFPVYRSLWFGAFAVNLGTWMQNVGATWLMATLTPSPLMVALIQTATYLPTVFLGLLGGVLADLVDRRRYLLLTQGSMFCTAIILAVTTATGHIGPSSLLALTTLYGIGIALQIPAWHTSQSESVPAYVLPTALTLTAATYNAARLIGPAAAGAIVVAFGVGTVFTVTALFFLVALVLVARWSYVRQDAMLPPERLLSGLRGAFRYTRHSQVMKLQIRRTIIFISSASSLWALLPILARDQLAAGAGGYGMLLGCMGAGAILGAFTLPILREKIEINRVATIGMAIYAAAMLITATVPHILTVGIVLVPAGAAWMIAGNINLAAMQTAIPSWIRARAMAVYMLTFNGSMALGSALWGFCADEIGASHAILLATVLAFVGLLAIRKHPVCLGSDAQMTMSAPEATAVTVFDLSPDDGPVAVEIEYRIDPEKKVEFTRAVQTIGVARRRDGADSWRLYRDLSDTSRYIERFIVESWAEYLRQQLRATVADRIAEEKVRAFHMGENPPRISHYLPESFA